MFYCACRSRFVPHRTWLILLAKCIWSAWPSSIIFLVAACEWALYYYFFSSFQLPDVPPYSGDFCTVQIQAAKVTTCGICPPPGLPTPLTTPASPAPISDCDPHSLPLPLGVLTCPSPCLQFSSSLTVPVAPSHPPGLCLREVFLDRSRVSAASPPAPRPPTLSLPPGAPHPAPLLARISICNICFANN